MDTNEEYENNHLVELGDSDYEIVDGEPDIKGWDVKNEQGQKIGEVDELLFDPETRKVRYIIVDLDDNELELEEDKKVLIPIGIAELYNSDDETEDETEEDDEIEDETSAGSEHEYEDETEEDNKAFEKKESTVVDDSETDKDDDEDGDDENEVYDAAYDGDVVIIPATLEQLKELPAYEKDNVSPETESTIRRIFEGTGAESSLVYNRNDFYEHEHFNESNYYDRSAATGTIIPENDYTETESLGSEDAQTGFSGNAPTQDNFPENMAGEGSASSDVIENKYSETEEGDDLMEK